MTTIVITMIEEVMSLIGISEDLQNSNGIMFYIQVVPSMLNLLVINSLSRQSHLALLQ